MLRHLFRVVAMACPRFYPAVTRWQPKCHKKDVDARDKHDLRMEGWFDRIGTSEPIGAAAPHKLIATEGTIFFSGGVHENVGVGGTRCGRSRGEW